MAVKITPKHLRTLGLTIEDAEAELLIEGAIATAYLVAPCLANAKHNSSQALAARAIIFGAIKRWATGATDGISSQNQSAGPFSNNVTFTPSSGKFSTAEKRDLREICAPNRGKAFAIDTMPGRGYDDWTQSFDETFDADLDDLPDTDSVYCAECEL